MNNQQCKIFSVFVWNLCFSLKVLFSSQPSFLSLGFVFFSFYTLVLPASLSFHLWIPKSSRWLTWKSLRNRDSKTNRTCPGYAEWHGLESKLRVEHGACSPPVSSWFSAHGVKDTVRVTSRVMTSLLPILAFLHMAWNMDNTIRVR